MSEEEQQELRVRLPKKGKGELFGVVTAELGGARFACLCSDGKERICRVPGRFRRKVWVREGNYVIVVPWSVEGDKRGDIVWRYKKLEVEWLNARGYLKELQ
ncbi:MAG: translation initiation factor eIF-1A [Methanobacteriota archaeon]|nr:MAG: translation initiation factor eIF-1A [Euryarchaeota archaeon]